MPGLPFVFAPDDRALRRVGSGGVRSRRERCPQVHGTGASSGAVPIRRRCDLPQSGDLSVRRLPCLPSGPPMAPPAPFARLQALWGPAAWPRGPPWRLDGPRDAASSGRMPAIVIRPTTAGFRRRIPEPGVPRRTSGPNCTRTRVSRGLDPGSPAPPCSGCPELNRGTSASRTPKMRLSIRHPPGTMWSELGGPAWRYPQKQGVTVTRPRQNLDRIDSPSPWRDTRRERIFRRSRCLATVSLRPWVRN